MLSVDQLTKTFSSAAGDTIAVDQLTFDVQPGEVYGLLGPNGAGKTTTLRMILGLVTPTSGSATVDGYSVADSPDEVKQRVGYASATTGVYPWLNARETLEFVGDLYQVEPDFVSQRIDELSKLLNFGHLLDQRCTTLSTGQRQRLNLARALLHDPPVMLMDEPTLGLDIVGSQIIFDYIAHLREMKKSVIVCTHRLDEAERLCDRFGLLHHGHKKMEGTLNELRQQTGHANLTDIFLDLIKNTSADSLS